MPTPKNKIVAEHYKKLGFDLIETEENGQETWLLNLDNYKYQQLPVEIIVQ